VRLLQNNERCFPLIFTITVVEFENIAAYLERQSMDASGFISGEEYPFD
jgi:hypothetical protein